MAGGVGHTGGLTNPRPWRGRCRAGYSNTGGPPLPRKRAPLQKKGSHLDQIFFYDPVVLESICYRTRANRLINESITISGLRKIRTGTTTI